MDSIYITPEHELLRDQIARFIAREVEPHALAWEEAGCVPREVLRKMGDAGLFGLMYGSSYGGAEMALAAAHHYRSLRASGITVRSALDVLVASFCIERDYALLHRDRDFDSFELQRGLRVWQH